MKPILALSTSWCSHRHEDGHAMLQEIAALGFSYAELSHGIRITLVPGILRAVEEGVVQISSTHNFCPLPTGATRAAPNFYEPSAPDSREREQWIRHTRRSIDFAAQVNARVVVCHLGRVRFLWFNPAKKLQRHLAIHPDAGRQPDDRKYTELVRRGLSRLRRRMPPDWERMNAAVREVFESARAKGVTLGFENRERFDELPLDADWPAFLERLGPEAPVGYWHDTGHADIKERMGLLQHRSHLEQLASRTLGFHLHDVTAGGQDHHPLGAGRIDFESVSRFWRPEHVLTLELGPRATADDVRDSKRRIEALAERQM